MMTSPITTACQVYLVAGGSTGSLIPDIDSTELLTVGASSWTEAAPLPRAMSLLQTVSLDNMVISTGEEKSSMSAQI